MKKASYNEVEFGAGDFVRLHFPEDYFNDTVKNVVVVWKADEDFFTDDEIDSENTVEKYTSDYGLMVTSSIEYPDKISIVESFDEVAEIDKLIAKPLSNLEKGDRLVFSSKVYPIMVSFTLSENMGFDEEYNLVVDSDNNEFYIPVIGEELLSDNSFQSYNYLGIFS